MVSSRLFEERPSRVLWGTSFKTFISLQQSLLSISTNLSVAPRNNTVLGSAGTLSRPQSGLNGKPHDGTFTCRNDYFSLRHQRVQTSAAERSDSDVVASPPIIISRIYQDWAWLFGYRISSFRVQNREIWLSFLDLHNLLNQGHHFTAFGLTWSVL